MLSPGSILPVLGRTQYSFGAVVLTLKATGWALLFEIVNMRLTELVNGLLKPNALDGESCTDMADGWRGKAGRAVS